MLALLQSFKRHLRGLTANQQLRTNQAGNSLIEVVTTVALTLAVIGSTLYAAIIVQNAMGNQLYETQKVVGLNGATTIFKEDVAQARNSHIEVEPDKVQLTLATTKNECISWSFANGSLERAKGASATELATAPSSPLIEKITNGSIVSGGDNYSISFMDSNSEEHTIIATTQVAKGSDNSCW